MARRLFEPRGDRQWRSPFRHSLALVRLKVCACGQEVRQVVPENADDSWFSRILDKIADMENTQTAFSEVLSTC